MWYSHLHKLISKSFVCLFLLLCFLLKFCPRLGSEYIPLFRDFIGIIYQRKHNSQHPNDSAIPLSSYLLSFIIKPRFQVTLLFRMFLPKHLFEQRSSNQSSVCSSYSEASVTPCNCDVNSRSFWRNFTILLSYHLYETKYSPRFLFPRNGLIKFRYDPSFIRIRCATEQEIRVLNVGVLWTHFSLFHISDNNLDSIRLNTCISNLI